MSRSRVVGVVGLGIMVAGAALCAGCSGGTRFDAGPSRTVEERADGMPVDFEAWQRVGYRLDWKGYPTVTGSLPITDVLVLPGAVAVLEGGTQLSVLEAGTGAQRCATQLANPLTRFRGLAAFNGRILAASEADQFQLDPATCALSAREPFVKIISTPPVTRGNLVIAGTPDGELLAQQDLPSIGSVKKWGYGSRGAIESRPVLVGDAVAAVTQAGEFFVLNADTGALLGRATLFGGVASDPATDGTRIFIASLDQSIYAFDTAGRELWRYRTPAPLRGQPVAIAGRLYCAVPGQGLTAFDAASGRVLWSAKGFDGNVVTLNKGSLVAFDGAQVVTINPANGDVLERAKAPGVASLRAESPTAGGPLYAVGASGVVAKFLPR